MFLTTKLCGALAIAFLRFMIFGNQLPTHTNEAEYIHAMLRTQFHEHIHKCQISHRPWIWGAGDRPKVSQTPEQYQAVAITRDARIDLINAHGHAMADDEVRFHIRQLIDRQPAVRDVAGSFTFFEPLVFSCWDSIGPRITEQWCSLHPEILREGRQIVSAAVIQDHWFPLWFVPSDTAIQIHTLNDIIDDMGQLETMIGFIAEKLGFSHWAIHRIPPAIETNGFCGAYAMSFLAHVIMRAELPDGASELRTYHTNMRASFVEYLYSVETTPQPVVWGNGPTRESGLLPIMPVEPDASNLGSQGACVCFTNVPTADPQIMPCDLCLCTTKGMIAESFEDRALLAKHNRLMMLSRHGYAMGDDEVLFHLQHLIDCHATRPASSHQVSREFEVIPPLIMTAWIHGEPEQLQEWVAQHPEARRKHLISVGWIEQHWFPLWFVPNDDALQCHTFHTPDDARLDHVTHALAEMLGYTARIGHRVPNPRYETGLCGTIAISFLAHIVLRTPLPCSDLDLRHRCWRMKETFADFVQPDHVPPALWGWGFLSESNKVCQAVMRSIMDIWESRPLPKLPEEEKPAMAKHLFDPLMIEYIGDTGESRPLRKLPGVFLDGTCQEDAEALPVGQHGKSLSDHPTHEACVIDGPPGQQCVTNGEITPQPSSDDLKLYIQGITGCRPGMLGVVCQDHEELCHTLLCFEQAAEDILLTAILESSRWRLLVAFKSASCLLVCFDDCVMLMVLSRIFPCVPSLPP